ncbi:MAG: hypothetical protein KatS3mg102_2827 [Planctomycetota bacterium]|nr:MAG: hypothetical protein KatS3mg102_2827 [Planctomycetota bacterium]
MSVEEPGTTLILPSRGGLVRLAFCGLAMTVACAALGPWAGWLGWQLPPLVRAAGWLGVAGFGGLVAYVLLRLVHMEPALVLDGEGIEDRASLAAAGRIGWEQIEDVELVQVFGERFIRVRLREPQAFLARQPAYKRWLMLWRLGPVALPARALSRPPEEVLALLRAGLARAAAAAARDGPAPAARPPAAPPAPPGAG